MEWVINTQLGRRNLPPAQRLAVVEKFKKKIQEDAKEKQLSTLKQNSNDRLLQTEKTKPFHTDKELAKLAGVGTGTVARFNRVMKSDDEGDFLFIRYNRHYAINGWKYCNI